MSCDQLSEEKKIKACFTDGYACHISTILNLTAAAMQQLPGTVVKDTGTAKYSQWAELLSAHGHIFCLENNIWRYVVFSGLWAVVNVLAT